MVTLHAAICWVIGRNDQKQTYFRLSFAYTAHVQGTAPKAGNTIAICAAVIAAIRLARVDDLSASPKVVATVHQSISLAHGIYEECAETVS